MFHVFIDGANDATPEGIRKLCEAIAARYGLRAPDLIGRMGKGRFRVKGNVDRATADSFARDLERLGARVSVEEATPGNSRATPQPFPAVKPAPKPAAPAAAPPQRPSTPAGGYQSGLAAAFSGETPAANLGVLAGDGAAFSLVSVDGADEAPAPEPPKSFEPPPQPAPKPAEPPKKAKPTKPKDEPLDLFAPPEAGAAEIKLDLAPEEVERAAKRASVPPPPQVAPLPVASSSSPSSSPSPSPMSGLAVGPRARFAAGILLAIVLGFIPAHLVARMREQSAYADIDAKAEAAGKSADTPEVYESLDKSRAVLLDHKYSDRRSIAMLALVVWAVFGGGIAYVWIRRWPTLD